jgi:hypothetical protein
LQYFVFSDSRDRDGKQFIERSWLINGAYPIRKSVVRETVKSSKQANCCNQWSRRSCQFLGTPVKLNRKDETTTFLSRRLAVKSQTKNGNAAVARPFCSRKMSARGASATSLRNCCASGGSRLNK